MQRKTRIWARNFANALAMTTALVVAGPASADSDPLPSWRDTVPKAAIVDFVKKVTAKGSPDFVPVPERVAVFDNDGTLAVERPMPAQLAFELDCVHLVAFKHPEWSTAQPFKAAIERDAKALAEAGAKGFAEIMVATHAGWNSEDYDSVLSDWIATTRHSRFKRPYTELVYQPMLELLAYLRANGFETFIISDGEIEFTRPWTEAVYGVSRAQIVGASIKTKLEMVDGKPALIRLPEANFVDDDTGKAAAIYEQIGRRPIVAIGNSDGDLEMLKWTTMTAGPHLGMLVHHTDADREYAYDRDGGFGHLDKALDAIRASGLTVIDMKSDWRRIFPFETQ